MLTLETVLERLSDAPHCRKFVETWQTWRRGKLVPTRADIDPTMLGKSLGAVSILEVQAPDQIIYRLAATTIESFTGRDLTRQNLMDFTPCEDREERVRRHQNVITQPCGLWLRRPLTSKAGVERVTEAVLLPVAKNEVSDIPLIYVGHEIVTPPAAGGVDMPRELVLATEHEYVDIGAGVP